jgi:hypothetical protein
MKTVQEVAAKNQASSHSLEKQEREIGMEIVRSADLASRFFHGPRPRHYLPVWDENEIWTPVYGRCHVMNGHTTIGEVAKPKPHRSSGAPGRCASHYQAILRLLRERAEEGQGVLGSELYSRLDLYGRSPRNRISELRRDGHLIEGKPSGSADWFYQLIRDNADVNPSASSQDWYTDSTGKERPKLEPEMTGPLFAETVRQ